MRACSRPARFVRHFLLAAATFWLAALAAAQSPEPAVVYLAGDSTMAPKLYERRPETGWGEMLQQFFAADEVRVENHARNGRSTRSFIAEARWAAVIAKLRAGDYVLIQFGHNDGAADRPDRYTPPDDYRANLVRFVREVRERNATPVLLTPLMRRRFDADGVLRDTHGPYPGIVRDVARELDVALLDVHRDSEALLAKLGAVESKKLYMNLRPGDSPNYPNGLDDNTHFTAAGALEMAKLAVRALRATKLELAAKLHPPGD